MHLCMTEQVLRLKPFLMAQRIKRQPHVLISAGLHPEYRDTIRSYVHGLHDDSAITEIPLAADGRTDWNQVANLAQPTTAGIVVGYPNFFGCVEDLHKAAEISHSTNVLLITATPEPYALSLLRSPGNCGADICVGEGQALAVPPQYGGPGVGLFGTRQKFVRQMPGRLVGQTVDKDGHSGYVLTLSTREQHIRREHATSNICTNHGLVALAMAIRTSILGRQGFVQTGQRCVNAAEYLRAEITRMDGFSLPYTATVFNEFVVRAERSTAAKALHRMLEHGIIGGVDLGKFDKSWCQDFLVATTELHPRDDLDRWLTTLAEARDHLG